MTAESDAESSAELRLAGLVRDQAPHRLHTVLVGRGLLEPSFSLFGVGAHAVAVSVAQPEVEFRGDIARRRCFFYPVRCLATVLPETAAGFVEHGQLHRGFVVTVVSNSRQIPYFI